MCAALKKLMYQRVQCWKANSRDTCVFDVFFESPGFLIVAKERGVPPEPEFEQREEKWFCSGDATGVLEARLRALKLQGSIKPPPSGFAEKDRLSLVMVMIGKAIP
jgi:hypothetical protein